MKLSELRRENATYYSTKTIDKNGSIELTILGVLIEDAFSPDDDKDKKKKRQVVLTFEGGKKFGLNKTNEIIMEQLFGGETDAWVNKKVALYHDPTVRGPSGQLGGIRIRGA